MTKPPAVETRLGMVVDGRYRLDAVLGVGGFGAVYRAHHLSLDHDVAIKLLHEDVGDVASKRLTREAKILARLDHPNCVRLTDFGSHAGTSYLVMELVAGASLSSRLGHAWPPMPAVELALELLAGLGHAHALGLVHRDLKPGNVLLVDEPRGGATVKIIDFGIVAIAAGEQLPAFTEQLTTTGRIIGTPRYMSPEQLLGAKIDARSDLYAFGLILYELLAGHPAFEASDAKQLAWMHAVAPPPLLPDEVPDELAVLVMALLAKKPQQRPASAEQVRELLLALLPSLADGPKPSPSKPSPPAVVDERPDPTAALPRDLTMATLAIDASTKDLPVSSTSTRDPTAFEPGRYVGRYVILRELGRGAMGVVYLGWDESLDRQAAIKLLRPGPAHHHANERMLREARALARVTHPNVVGVYEFGAHQQQLFVAMQYVRGRTLRAWLDERARPWTETLARVLEAGRGLAAAHAAGLVHRDFKPDNVLVGTDEHARVVDFGLVRAASPAFDMIDRLASGLADDGFGDPLAAKLTRSGAIIGTPAYMALEQLAGDHVDARADQFAFCAVAHEALYGARPFVGRSLEELAAKLTAGHIEPRPADSPVPKPIDEVLARGLQVMPSSRWPSMDALLDALEQAAGQRRPRWTRPLIAAGIGVAVLGVAVSVFGGDDAVEPDSPTTADAPALDPQLEARVAELQRALDDTRAQLAQARPEDPESLRAVIELADRQGDPMPPELRAAVDAVASVVHEREPLREIGQVTHVLAWSPTDVRENNPPKLALARPSGDVVVWQTSARMLAHAGPIESLGFSRDGQLLVARDRQHRAILWHVSTGTELAVVDEPNLRIAAFTADAPELVIVSDAGVSLWALVRGKELARARALSDEAEVLALATVEDRVVMLSAQGRVHTWTRATDQLTSVTLDGFDREAGPFSCSPDATRIASSSPAAIELWDTSTGKRVSVQAPAHAKLGVHAFSPDSQTLAVAIRGHGPLLVDTRTGDTRDSELRLDPAAITFDPSGRLLALAADGQLEIASNEGVERITGLTGALALAISAESDQLAIIDADGIAWVWASRSIAARDPGLDEAAKLERLRRVEVANNR